MTPNLLEEFRDFEIFTEKMEEIVEEIKRSHLTDEEGNVIYKIEHFDLRDDKIGSVASIPETLEDYLHLWRYVQERFNEYLVNCDNPDYPNEMFFDVYWNSVEANSAFYDDLAIWIYFDYEYGVFYESDTEIIEKVRKRDERIERLARNLQEN